MIEPRKYNLPRLAPEFYRGDAVVHWTLPISMRAKGWLNSRVHSQFRELLMHTAARENLLCPAYCLMPDHLHLIWMGLSPKTDQLRGMAFLRTYLEPSLNSATFQHQAHDHVLKDEERRRNAFAIICSYILNNPMRAELISRPEDWQYHGVVVPGYPEMTPFQDNFWPFFWRHYKKVKQPEAGQRKLPPRSV
jgi:putative transposase